MDNNKVEEIIYSANVCNNRLS